MECAAGNAELDRFVHLYMVNRGILTAPSEEAADELVEVDG